MSLNLTISRSRTDLRVLGLLITTLGLGACEREPSDDGTADSGTTTATSTTTDQASEPAPSSSSTSVGSTPTEPTEGTAVELPEGCDCYEASTDPLASAAYTCEQGMDCGRYVDRDRDDGEDTGEAPGDCSPDCETEESNNNAVVECVLEAAATGVAFEFKSTDDLGDGQFSTVYTYYVRPNEPMHSIRTQNEDLDAYVDSVVNAPVDFEACQGLESLEGWNCINTVVMESSTTVACESKTISFGG